MVYGTLIFSQSLGYIDAAVVNLIEQIDNQVNLVPTIIIETVRSLNHLEGKGKEILSVVLSCFIFGFGAIFGASAKCLLDSA